MSSCQVKGCTNNRKFAREGISFHLFPKEGPLVEKWLEAVGKNPNQWKWTKNTVVCSRHFTKGDFHKRGVRTVIRPTAVPSVNLDLNTHAQITEYNNAKSPPSSDDETEGLNGTELLSAQVSDEELDSDSNETKRSLNEFIESIHSYCVSPEMLEQQNSWLRGKLAYYRRALSVAKKQVQELKFENTALKTALGYVNTEQFMPEHLEENHQNVQPSDDLKWWNVSSCK